MKPVLVVDDEPQVRMLVKALLSKEGFESIEANDGCSAFATAQKLDGEISLLLTDINMPGSPVNGIELAGAIKDEFPEVPVLFVSAGLIPATDLDSAAPGNLFVKKPFDLRVLATSALKLVAGTSQQHQGPIRAPVAATRQGILWSRFLQRCSGRGQMPILASKADRNK
jgi:CheY-like chemotaxis protein